MNKIVSAFKAIWNFLYMYSGFIGYIHQMIFRRKRYQADDQRPSQIVFWLLGAYAAYFGLVIQRYELRVNRLMTRYTAFVEQLNPDVEQSILQGFIDLQSDSIPIRPVFASQSVFTTLWTDEPFSDVVGDVANMAPAYFNSKKVFKIKNFRTPNDIVLINLEKNIIFESCTFNKVEFYGAQYAKIHFEYSSVNTLMISKSWISSLEIFSSSISEIYITDSDFYFASLTGDYGVFFGCRFIDSDLFLDKLVTAKSFFFSSNLVYQKTDNRMPNYLVHSKIFSEFLRINPFNNSLESSWNDSTITNNISLSGVIRESDSLQSIAPRPLHWEDGNITYIPSFNRKLREFVKSEGW